MAATPESLQKFVTYCQQHITGDEKGQAQIFLDRFFQAFGHAGALEAGATYEERIEKGSKKGQMGFADLVWKKHVLIEMKKRGENLTKREYRAQTERYYIRLKKDDRPRYVMMCNFDEFHIYDFDIQPDEPLDIITLKQLPVRSPAFAFMESTVHRPIFKNNQVEITEKAASRMGLLLEMLITRGKERRFVNFTESQAQRFVLQCVLAMFAEDRGLLPLGLFTRCVKDCLEGASTYDVLGGLFQAMNQQGVTPQQFYGMDINLFAVELARVTLMIGRKVAIDNLGLKEPSLPLDTLDENIICADALFTEWVKADAIIGNPPFLGGKHTRIVLGDKYIDRVFERFSDVKDSVDFCSYWFRIAHNNLGSNGRAGLVATNSISQGKSRAAGLDYIAQNGGYIYDAISTQPWSGEAKVHVSIVNWSKEKPKGYNLDSRPVISINSSLQATIDVSQAARLSANLNKCFQGVIPLGMGFIVSEQQAQDWIKADLKNQDVLKLFSMGANLAQNPQGRPERWVIDFNDMMIEEAIDYAIPFEHIKATVKPERDKNRRDTRRINWWKFGENAPKMRKAIAPLSHYFTVPRVSKWAVFISAPVSWLPGDKSVVVASEDFYLFGILTSKVHRTWMNAQKSTLKADIAYTHNTCFETFPFPQIPNSQLVEQIRETAEKLHQYRTQQMSAKQWGITQLYNKFFNEPTSQLYKIHAQLDQQVMQLYGFSNGDDILEKLLKLNVELAEKEKRSELVVGPYTPNF